MMKLQNNSNQSFMDRKNSPVSKAGDKALCLRSADLFAKGRQIIIEHNGEEYRLRLTRNEKLILTK